MTNMDIDDEVYNEWMDFWKQQDQLEYPTLKNFTAKKLRELMKKGR